MDDLLARLIADFHERPFPALTRRRLAIPRVKGKINVLVGMRRSGKTYLCQQAMQELESQGTPRERILYLNFDDERLISMTTADLARIPEVYYRLFPNHKDRECHFFLDEIQRIPGWELFVRRILDTENARIVVTGSSSKLLSREIATQLRGRALTTEVFPFDFQEFLAHRGIPPPGPRPGTRARALFEHQAQAFLRTGGFPEIQNLDAPLSVEILRSYVDVTVLRDVIERHRIRNAVVLRLLLRQILHGATAKFSVNKFFRVLKSQGLAATKNHLYAYLDHLADAYLIHPAALHARSERARQVNPRKIYIADNGIIEAATLRPAPDYGLLLENAVFLRLRRSAEAVDYAVTSEGLEVDFVAVRRRGKRELIQSAFDLSDPETRARETRALSSAMAELKVRRGTIVTFREEGRLRAAPGEIEIVPCWRFL